MERTLLLNATYEPLQVVSWKRAIRMHFQGKVDVVEVYERQVRSVTLSLQVPSVIKLQHYVRVKPQHARVKFSRSNLFARDKYRCQYCGEDQLTAKLTYDHVVPVARGGQTSWENIVTSCLACNRRKGNRTPEEAGLRLLKRPLAPLGFPAKVQLVLARVQAPDAWKQYIFC